MLGINGEHTPGEEAVFGEDCNSVGEEDSSNGMSGRLAGELARN